MLILSKKHTTPKERFRQKDIMSKILSPQSLRDSPP